MTSRPLHALLLSTALATSLLAGVASPALAQPQPAPAAVDTYTVPDVGTVTVLTYKVQFVSADPATRQVVLETPAGARWAVIAPPLVGDLSYFRNGESLIIRKLPGVVTALTKAHRGKPGEVLKEVVVDAGLPGWPEGFGLREVVLTNPFVAINLAGGTVSFVGPDGDLRTLKAANAKVLEDLAKIQPGDLAQITYLEGLAINAVR